MQCLLQEHQNFAVKQASEFLVDLLCKISNPLVEDVNLYCFDLHDVFLDENRGVAQMLSHFFKLVVVIGKRHKELPKAPVFQFGSVGFGDSFALELFDLLIHIMFGFLLKLLNLSDQMVYVAGALFHEYNFFVLCKPEVRADCFDERFKRGKVELGRPKSAHLVF